MEAEVSSAWWKALQKQHRMSFRVSRVGDKLQKRKVLALIGYFVSALGKPPMGIATAWPGVLGGRFLDRFGAGFRSAPRDALIASSVSDEYKGEPLALRALATI
jgi:hypothetical protein